jgi:hypothetical protein
MPIIALILEIASGVSSIVGLIKDIIGWIQSFNNNHSDKTKALKDLHAAFNFYKKTGDASQLQILHEQYKSKNSQQGEL